MVFEEAWDKIVDEFSYFISFEWFSDMIEFAQGMFENLSEFSPIGTIYGVIMVFLVFFFRNSVFAFVNTLGVGKIIWYILFYIFAFIIGYIMGRKIWD